MKTRVCLECGHPLPPGRSDMKFCSVSCRSRWHYRLSGSNRGMRLKTIGAINRNYDILCSLLEEGTVSIDVPDLSAMGFNFDCITSYHKVRKHNEYRVYDIKFFKSESRVFGLGRAGAQERRTKK
ncbi:MAG: hypothetical protein MJY84_01590 [Bacteroidales bacterium]|nr:hypothetical protein [Bacteroidales bacterium]